MTYGTSKWRSWVLDEDASRPFIKRALEAGINFFDTADMYSNGASEEVVGRAIRDFAKRDEGAADKSHTSSWRAPFVPRGAGGEEVVGRAIRDFAKRDEVVLATKVFFRTGPGSNDEGLSRKHIMAAIDASLRRLGTDYVDLYQIHRFDASTPVEETMEALHDVVKSGKARYIGASSMWAWRFAKMLRAAERGGWTKFVSMQNHYNLVYREEEREVIPMCADEGIGVIPWSPLARGFLAEIGRASC